MACGDKYRSLLRTSVGGYTADDPYPLITIEHHYSQWYDTIVALRPRINRRWSELRKLELENDGDTTASDSVVPGIRAFNDALDALMVPFDLLNPNTGVISPARKIDQAIAVGELATCQLERIDEAAESLGYEMPEIHAPDEPQHKGGPGILESIQTVGVLALVVGGLYLGARYAWRTRDRDMDDGGYE